MSTVQKTKIKRRLNPAVYSMLTGVIFIVVGYMWLKVVDILIDIDGFGLGDIIHILPYAGYATIALGAILIFVNLIRMVISKPVVKEQVSIQTKKKNVDPRLIHETSKFEKKYIKGLVFDLDGTLLNTIEDLADAGNSVLNQMGFKTASLDVYQAGLGNGLRNLMKSVLPPETSEDIIDLAHQEMLKTYNQNYMNKTKPYEGVEEMLEQLFKRGYLLSVVSNKKDEFTQALVKKHFPNVLFVDVIGERSDFPRKPDPALPRLISDKMMLPVTQLAMIGDSEVDIQTAHNANMFSFAVTWGYRNQEELQLLEPDVIIEIPSELVMQLDMINTKEIIDNKKEA